MGGHCLSCREGDSEQGLQLGKGSTLPEGQGGLFHQISQAFQLRPKGREMYFSFPTRQVSLVGPLRMASLFPTRLLCLSPTCLLISPTSPRVQASNAFLGHDVFFWRAAHCVGKHLHLDQPAASPENFPLLLLSPADPASAALPGETFTI